MAMDVEQTPFLKQLADSDSMCDTNILLSPKSPKHVQELLAHTCSVPCSSLMVLDPEVRDKAFASLERYLTCGRTFSDLELLKLWRGLYYSTRVRRAADGKPPQVQVGRALMGHLDLYHTPLKNAGPQLAALHALQQGVPVGLTVPFARAFWTTIAALMPTLDAHRVDKFLALQRRMLHAQLVALAQHGWPTAAQRAWIGVMSNAREGPLGVSGGSSGDESRVGDGIRYHVLDVLLDEMERVHDAHSEGVPLEVTDAMHALVVLLAEKGTRGVRVRASEVLADPRWKVLRGESPEPEEAVNRATDKGGEDEEWSGFEDD